MSTPQRHDEGQEARTRRELLERDNETGDGEAAHEENGAWGQRRSREQVLLGGSSEHGMDENGRGWQGSGVRVLERSTAAIAQIQRGDAEGNETDSSEDDLEPSIRMHLKEVFGRVTDLHRA